MPIDYKRYPTNWKTEIVPAVRARSGGMCEFCGLPNGEPVYVISLSVREDNRYKQRSIWFRNQRDAIRESINGEVRTVKVVLTVAHLDHDETNMDVSIDRLKDLCQLCHLRYDAKEKYRRSVINWPTNKVNKN